MDAYLTILTLLALSFIGVVFLGLVAGFSATLFIAQTALYTKKSETKRYTYSLIAGVLATLIILVTLFQVMNLTTLIATLDSALEALFLSVAFNVFIGFLFIVAGTRYVYSRKARQVYDADTRALKKAGGASAFFGFGFAKTFLSVSSTTALFVAGNIIASTGTDIPVRLIFTFAFLIAALVPFWSVLHFIRKRPEYIEQAVLQVKTHITTLNYRLTVGVAALLFGAALIVINAMLALFY